MQFQKFSEYVSRFLVSLSFVTCVSPTNVWADSFNFNFSIGSHNITGSFDGTASGNLITGLSNISVVVDSVGFVDNGFLYGQSTYAGVGGGVPGAAVVSFDGWENDFLFIDVNYPLVLEFHQYLISSSFGMYQAVLTDLAGVFAEEGVALPSGWAVTAVSPVPEPETYAMLLAGLGLLGFAARRRKQKEAALA